MTVAATAHDDLDAYLSDPRRFVMDEYRRLRNQISGALVLWPLDGAIDWSTATPSLFERVGEHPDDIEIADIPRLAVLTQDWHVLIPSAPRTCFTVTMIDEDGEISVDFGASPLPAAEDIIRTAHDSGDAIPETFEIAGFVPEPANDNQRGALTFMGDERDYCPKPELVRDTIPRTGVGFFGGQSGALKTFFAIHAATCLMTGEALAGRDIERTGGVVYLAAEGEGTIEGRLKARRMQMQDPGERLPFYTLTRFGAITDSAAYAALERRLVQADEQMRAAFGVPLVAVVVDTVAAAGMIPEDKENDPGAWQKVFHALQPISERLDIVIILIHHAGKNASAGLRGSSNARAAADFALMLACDRDEITGDTRNHFLHLAKSRDAAEGPIAAIQKRTVEIARRDDDTPITTLVLDFDTAGKEPALRLKTSKTDKPLREAFDACELHRVHVHGERTAAEVRAAKVDDLRREFSLRYVTAQADPVKRADNVRGALRTAVTRARDCGDYCTGAWGGSEWIWRIKP